MTIQERITWACEDSGEVSIRSYSGRAMYGAKCVGIVGSMKDCMAIIGAVFKEQLTDLLDDVYDDEDTPRTDTLVSNYHDTVDDLMRFDVDSMGHNVVVYWPQIKWIDRGEAVG